jgi:cell wall-associated NlpC family hydrolase
MQNNNILILAYAYCNVPVMPVRKEPTHTAEQTTQMLFGEKAEILEVNNMEWARIRVSWDDYDGWCKVSQLSMVQKKEFRKEIKYMAGGQADRLIMKDGDMWLPLGSDLIGMKSGKLKAVNETGKFKGKKIRLKNVAPDRDALREAALRYMHAPYQWGGRSIAGIDCSGLTQMAYKLCNHKIPRDASQQAQAGELVGFLQDSQCGDLAFFDNKEGKITHVGMLLDNQTILHAADTAGKVGIDKIDQGGIISLTLKRRTHNLRMVKRMI